MTTPGTTSARERLLVAAARLFYERGIHATGIDTITREAGVAKMSLYNNFASKDELVSAYLDRRHEEWLALYRARLAGAATPTASVLAVFDAYLDHAAASGGFRGCGLLNAAAELSTGSAGRRAVRRHKEEVESILASHLHEAAVDDAAATAEHLALLLEGAVERAGLEGDPRRLESARRLAVTVLDAS
ncbi:TetR/AcrR family transcriptional regulator [Pseudoclavibacter chungangensis]|uniref:TetR/AcrR family transcriptional regulator n=1 Tax=Pseudoclavibacter chungangensis TaxID=587635 RepID=A0A7J5BNH3_9MICO|nr:TetR/AcrR family transcriptional regulator [Pseudoclavibacter chungangensis]KAB1653609.1 TetR/AcrR family transcriptional regulator [Pseudoclavibacter chungangensis]NYJ68714.1 AcrR family transcriptional regulator [Pseudoclavibacter chungangensis]